VALCVASQTLPASLVDVAPMTFQPDATTAEALDGIELTARQAVVTGATSAASGSGAVPR